MKITRVLFTGILVAFSPAVFAGIVSPFPVTVTLNPDGSGAASGDMLTARVSTNDGEFIGCGFRLFEFPTGPFRFGFCQAEDSNENRVFCSSSSPDLLQAMKSVSAFSFITFDFDADGVCTRIGFSAQSFYIPDNVHKGKGKGKGSKN